MKWQPWIYVLVSTIILLMHEMCVYVRVSPGCNVVMVHVCGEYWWLLAWPSGFYCWPSEMMKWSRSGETNGSHTACLHSVTAPLPFKTRLSSQLSSIQYSDVSSRVGWSQCLVIAITAPWWAWQLPQDLSHKFLMKCLRLVGKITFWMWTSVVQSHQAICQTAEKVSQIHLEVVSWTDPSNVFRPVSEKHTQPLCLQY